MTPWWRTGEALAPSLRYITRRPSLRSRLGQQFHPPPVALALRRSAETEATTGGRGALGPTDARAAEQEHGEPSRRHDRAGDQERGRGRVVRAGGSDGDRVEMMPVTPTRKIATIGGLLGLLAVAPWRLRT